MQSSDPSTQAGVAEEVNSRLVKAQKDLAEKYEQGRGGVETSVDGPTGVAYKELEKKQQAEQRANKKASRASADDGFLHDESLTETQGDEESDADFELRQIREQRLKQLKHQQREKLENLGKGHGQYREILQDEFLNEATSSERVVCHFYHDDFPRCAIMNKHLLILAARHVETKFVKINAAKAPFFVDKLKVVSIPTVILFVGGVGVDKIIGFEGLSDRMPEGKADEWPTILLARLLAAKKMIYNSSVVDDEGEEAALKAKMDKARLSYMQTAHADDDDFELEDM